MAYTLIAFKRESKFYDRGDTEVLPARLVVEQYDDPGELLARVTVLSTDTPRVEYKYGTEPDCEFEEFYVFEGAAPVDMDGEIHDHVKEWRRVNDPDRYARDLRIEENMSNANLIQVLKRLGKWPLDEASKDGSHD